MQEEKTTEENEEQHLRDLLRLWDAPVPQRSLDARVLASFRNRQPRPGLWRRLLGFSIAVPAPVAVVGLPILIASAFLIGQYHGREARNPGLIGPTTTVELSPAAAAEEAAVAPLPPDKRAKESARRQRRDPDPRTAVARMQSILRPVNGAAAYRTDIDLAGFTPAAEVRMSIIRRPPSHDEKN